jgi:hybrid cluster-associated redox disulfide protein
MQLWPETVQIFVRHHMACPGCPIAGFHTLAEIAAEYRMDIDTLIAELHACESQADHAGSHE